MRLLRSTLQLLLTGLLATLLPPALAAEFPPGVSAEAEVEGIQAFRLANGLQLLLVPDSSKPTTTVNVTYRVGSRHENYGETGMAHLLEHLLFKGTPTHKNLWAEFGKRGLRANGTTWVDRTNYFASFSANDDTLRWYLGWQADAMVNSLIARADLDTEMTVVRNEMEAGENDPSRTLWQKTMATMYQWHNYGKSTIGARSDVENVDIARLQAFYRRHYQPDNATLVVAGRFDSAQVLRWVAELFGPIPRPSRVLEPTYTLDPAQDGERTVTVRRVGGNPVLMMAYHTPPGSSPDAGAVSILAQVLGDTPGGRLHKRLVEGQLAAQAFGFALDLAEPGALFLGAQLAPGQDVDKARTAMAATIDALAGAEPVTQAELDRARTQIVNAWNVGFTDPEQVGVALSEAVAMGDWRLYFLARDHVKQATLADVQRVAAAYLVPDNRTVGTYLPTAEPRRAPAPAKVDVAALVKGYRGDPSVAQAEVFDPTPANLDARTQISALASGLRAGLLPKGTRGQAVQARLQFHLGDLASMQGQATVAGFVGALLDKGGAGLTRQQVADRFDQLRAQVGFGLHGQDLMVNVTTVRETLPEVVRLIGRLLHEPAFPPEALEEVRANWLAAIERNRKEPGAVAADQLARHGNPYPRGDLRHAPTFDQQVEDVKAVTAEQLKAFHRRFLSAARSEFAAVGDFDAAAVNAALAAAFGDWKTPAAGPLPFVRAPDPLVSVAAARFMLRTPDKPNAELRATLALPLNDLHPDYPALTLANHMFGFVGNSRLWIRIREQGGLSYDVRSWIEWSREDLNTPWRASAIFAPENQPKVEAALMDELERSRRDGFTQQELDEAREGLLKLRRLSRAQDDRVAGALVSNLYLERNFALSQKVDDALAAATLAEVNAAWRRYIDPSRIVFAWGGDFKP